MDLINIGDFVGIAVVGSLLTLVVKSIKDYFGTEGNITKLLTISLSIVVGGVYVWLRQTIWWETIIGVLAAASTVYALLLK
jgi:hypothetical protein